MKKTFTLLDIVRRRQPPGNWVEGEKIPWNESDFSERMLAEHLTQAHDAASRRAALIDRHVRWIHEAVLGGQPTRVLDLGCGPGLYASRLARLGHSCVGVDFSPASIRHAREVAQAEGLDCTYLEGDLRHIEPGEGFGCALLIYGEFNVFRREDARAILHQAHRALADGGALVLEPHTFAAVEKIGRRPSSWYSAESGLFSAGPHIYLDEAFWDEDACVATERYYIIDAESGAVRRYASSMQAYTDDEYRTLLAECGFGSITLYPSLTRQPEPGWEDLLAITARKEPVP